MLAVMGANEALSRRAQLHTLRNKLAAKGLYPVYVKVARMASGALTRVVGDAAHPEPLPGREEVVVNAFGMRTLHEVHDDPTVRVRLRAATLWGGKSVAAGTFVEVPASEVTWLE